MTSTSNTSTNTRRKIRQISVEEPQPKKMRKYTLLNLRQMWFISPVDGQAVNVDSLAEDGATDEQWTSFLRKFVRLKPEQATQAWGIMARCDVLNWIDEHGSKHHQPKFHASKEAAEISVDGGKKAEEPKLTEISAAAKLDEGA